MSKLVLEVVTAKQLQVGDHVFIGPRKRRVLHDDGSITECVNLRPHADAEPRQIDVPLIWYRVYEIMTFDLRRDRGGINAGPGKIGVRTGRSKSFDVKWYDPDAEIERLRVRK